MSHPTAHKNRSDFDRLAPLDSLSRNHDLLHHPYFFSHLPSPCRSAFEIGCGTGAFSHALAAHSDQVLALDLSPEMIRFARQREPRLANAEFEIADAQTWPFPLERFDCVASIATVHHLEPRALFARIYDALRPGDVLTLFVSAAIRLARTGRLRDPRAVREDGDEHERGETYPRMSEVRAICRGLLLGT